MGQYKFTDKYDNVYNMEYSPDNDKLIISCDSIIMIIESYVTKVKYIGFDDTYLQKFITDDIKNLIILERTKFLQNKTKLINLKLTDDKLILSFNKYFDINKFITNKYTAKGTGGYSNGDIFVTRMLDLIEVFISNNYKKNIFKFLEIYPECKNDISKFISLDNNSLKYNKDEQPIKKWYIELFYKFRRDN